jgi:uncharacterized delta-60 repeat protein
MSGGNAARYALSVVVCSCCLSVGTAQAAPGDPDTSFGSGTGFSRADFGGGEAGTSVALQPDGKIVVAGEGTKEEKRHILVARFEPDGGLDLSYGLGTGASRPEFEGEQTAAAVAVQPSGRIVAGGGSLSIIASTLFVTRLLSPQGSTDTSFAGGAGFLNPEFGLGFANAIALEPNGGIVMAGSSKTAVTNPPRFLVVKLTPEGTLDTSYGQGTGASRPVFASRDSGTAVALQPDGEIVEAGTSQAEGAQTTSTDFMVTRYENPAGLLDTTFDQSAQRALIDFGAQDSATAVAVQPDGKIVVAGSTRSNESSDFAVARLLPDGTPDNSFGVGGKVTIDFGGDDTASAMALQPDGRIVLAGTHAVGTAKDIAVARLQPGGTLDTTFGNGGKKVLDFGGQEEARAIALRADGRIVLAGTTVDSRGRDLLVVRLLGDPPATGDESEGGGAGPAGPGSPGSSGTIPKCQGRPATIVGNNGANKLTGTSHADVIVGLGGNDAIKGGGGNDLICGGDGNDRLGGGAGSDRLFGQKGNDTITGGAGGDAINGGPGKDALRGQGGNDKIVGGPGKDRIDGGTGKNKAHQ